MSWCTTFLEHDVQGPIELDTDNEQTATELSRLLTNILWVSFVNSKLKT